MAAAAIVGARDELVRELPEDSFEQIHQVADAGAHTRSFELPVPGKIVDVEGMKKCRVTVNGRDFPHLIPETDYWGLYFRVRAIAAKPFRSASGSVASEHIVALQKWGELDIPASFIQHVLRVAADTTTAVDDLRRGNAGKFEVARTVRRARAQLTRDLPGEIWLVVNRDAARAREGEVFTFPSSSY